MFQYINYSDLFQPKDILVYLRKSRADDPLMTVEDVLAKHETMLDEWAEKNLGGTVPPENKFFEVVSGETIADRPELQKVLRMIESPKVKAILCYDVSRISRGDLEDAGRLMKLFRFTNTYIITLQKTYDLRDEFDRDQFERELKRGNEYLEYFKKISNNGRLLSIQQGNYIGNVAPYGYDKTIVTDGKRKCHSLTPNPVESEIVRMIFDMYVNQNIAVPTIANKLNAIKAPTRKGTYWSQASIKDILKNVHYIGKVRWFGRKTVNLVEDGEIKKSRPRTPDECLIFEGKHPAIIDADTFRRAQEMPARHPPVKVQNKIRNPLAGLVYCQCGHSMTYRTHSKCAPRLLCDNQINCRTRSCNYSDILDAVISVLKNNIVDFRIKANANDDTAREFRDGQISRLKTKLAELDKREISQWEMYSSGEMPKEIFNRLNDKIKTEKTETQQALDSALADNPPSVDYAEKLCTFCDALNALTDDTVSAELKNRMLKACIKRITYRRGDPDGTYTGKWENTPIELDIQLRV